MTTNEDRGPGADPGRSNADEAARGGMPGDLGAGRREEVGGSGVRPFDAADTTDAEVRVAGSWGRSDYDESGTSEGGALEAADAPVDGPVPGGDQPRH